MTSKPEDKRAQWSHRRAHNAAMRRRCSATGSISRVLSWTAIYLDPPLPTGSSHLLGTAGPAHVPCTVLLRIEFTASRCSHGTGELLPHLFTLTLRKGRYLSVALVLGSPPAGVTRYPCPVEPGLSSQDAFRRSRAAVRPGCRNIVPYFFRVVKPREKILTVILKEAIWTCNGVLFCRKEARSGRGKSFPVKQAAWNRTFLFKLRCKVTRKRLY